MQSQALFIIFEAILALQANQKIVSNIFSLSILRRNFQLSMRIVSFSIPEHPK